MTTETKTNEARDVALSQATELEFLHQFSGASDWEEVDEGFAMNFDTSEDVSDMIGQWLNSDVLDIRATYSLNPKSLIEVEVMTAFGGPTVWVSYNGNQDGTLMVKAYWGGDRWETHATAPNVAAYLWECVEECE
jgi:hypothetical protein